MQIKRMNVLYVFMAVALSIIFCESVKAQPKIAEKYLDSVINHYLVQSKMVGLAGAIIVNGKIVWMKGYGVADKEKNIPFTPNTVMNAGSIAKTVTGVCMMRLVEEKKLSLDADINTYLPFKVINPYAPQEKITLRMIATHSSSLADRDPFYGDSTYFTEKDSPEPLGEFLKQYYVPGGKHYSDSNFYQAKPGAYWEYSNIAASLAGYIVELVSGKKLYDYSQEIIFKPLGMKNASWLLSRTDLSKHAKLYLNQGDKTINIPLYGFTTYPDGGFRTSVADLAPFFSMLLNGGVYKGKRILKKETVAEMQRLQFDAMNKPLNMDLTTKNEGLFWRTKNDVTFFGHGGNDRGVKTLMLTDKSKEVGVILFTNTQDDNNKRTFGYFFLFDELMKYAISKNNQ